MAGNVEHTFDAIYSDLISQGDRTRVKDLLALFVIFNMIKRISDQAKNICEETVFAATGETKEERVHKILFVDEENSSLSVMAEAIARRTFPDSAHFSSAGREPAERLDPEMTTFMLEHGFDMEGLEPQSIDVENLGEYFVVVSLQGPAKSYLPSIPFHTSVLEWDVEPDAGGFSGSDRYEELYRQISTEIRDLMLTMRGEEAD